jgi:hypothetical protein
MYLFDRLNAEQVPVYYRSFKGRNLMQVEYSATAKCEARK